LSEVHALSTECPSSSVCDFVMVTTAQCDSNQTRGKNKRKVSQNEKIP